MKKELFKKWYKEYGRELAIETCPYDYKEMEYDVWEKELRRKAKKIFSSVYNMYCNEMVDRLCEVQDEVFLALNRMQEDLNNAVGFRIKIENNLKEFRDFSTELYDVHNEKKIDDEYFKKMKSFYGEGISDYKQNLHNVETVIKEIKKAMKKTECLIISE